ncbi:hypothetical protein AQI96_15460 [Streptomyces canus]|nr:hypothetical protein AQI96_15460 [Streptomyces canus]
MPNSVRPALVGGWGQALPLLLIAGALLLSGVLGLLQGGGISVLPGSVFALAVLRGFSTVEARNWSAR